MPLRHLITLIADIHFVNFYESCQAAGQILKLNSKIKTGKQSAIQPSQQQKRRAALPLLNISRKDQLLETYSVARG